MARILLVDDDWDQLELRTLILEKKGHDVRAAMGCAQCLAVLEEFSPDVVITDLLLPRSCDGEAMIRSVRARCSAARIVVLSGYGGEIDAPADAVLRKPVRTESLLAAIAKLAVCLLLFVARAADFSFTTTGSASEVTAELSARGPAGTIVELHVDDGPAFHVNLFAGERDWRYPIFLGRFDAGPHRIRVADINGVTASLGAIRQLTASDSLYDVVANAPVLYARLNTIGKFTDVPLLAYATRTTEDGRRVLEYTVIFSNEDGGTSSRNLMSRWGRVTDIEYVYHVWLNADGSPQRALIQGKDHKDIEYAGKHFAWHPVLIPVTDNNMVHFDGESPIRYQIAPRLVDLSQHSREIVMDDEPFAYRISAEEMQREGKLRPYGVIDGEKISDPRNYLVVEAKLTVENAGMQALIRVKGENRWVGGALGMAENFINRSGWIRTAIELPPGAQPEAIAFECLTPKRSGACRLEAIGRIFKLTPDYQPGANLAPRVPPAIVAPGEIVPIPLP